MRINFTFQPKISDSSRLGVLQQPLAPPAIRLCPKCLKDSSDMSADLSCSITFSASWDTLIILYSSLARTCVMMHVSKHLCTDAICRAYWAKSLLASYLWRLFKISNTTILPGNDLQKSFHYNRRWIRNHVAIRWHQCLQTWMSLQLFETFLNPTSQKICH